MAAALAGCASRAAPDVTPGGTARFPEFMFPAVPGDLTRWADAAASHERGWRLLQAGDLRNAERAFGEAVSETPRFHPALVGAGYVKVAAGQFEEAVERFNRALALSSTYVPAMVGKGEALVGLQRLDDARQAFAAALAADPSLTSLRQRIDVLQLRVVQEQVALARRAAQGGRPAEARAAYRTALGTSPDSAFLHRELALIELKSGDLEGAFAHAARAAELDPADTRAMLLLADVHETRGDLEAAAALVARAAAIEPTDALTRRMASLRERAALARLPAEYRAIPTAPTISRGELAALIGIQLPHLLQRAPAGGAIVMTDTREHWAATWILAVTRAGLMEPYANHTFQPGAVVGRGDLARMAAAALNLVAARDPALARSWLGARETFADLPASHLNYPAASRVVSAGIMATLDGNSFRWTQAVSGAEAVRAIERLDALDRSSRR